jgi:hypothetical protein
VQLEFRRRAWNTRSRRQRPEFRRLNFLESSLLYGVIHPASDEGVELRVCKVANSFLAIETLSLSFTNNFTSNNYADLADSVKLGVESPSIDLVGVDRRAESDSGGVDLISF